MQILKGVTHHFTFRLLSPNSIEPLDVVAGDYTGTLAIYDRKGITPLKRADTTDVVINLTPVVDSIYTGLMEGDVTPLDSELGVVEMGALVDNYYIRYLYSGIATFTPAIETVDTPIIYVRVNAIAFLNNGAT